MSYQLIAQAAPGESQPYDPGHRTGHILQRLEVLYEQHTHLASRVAMRAADMTDLAQRIATCVGGEGEMPPAQQHKRRQK